MQAGYFLSGGSKMITRTHTLLLTTILALVLGTPSSAADRNALRYAQATPPSDAAAPPAAPPAAAPAAPAPAAAPPAAAPPAAAATAAAAAPARLAGLQAWSALVGNSISGMEDGKPLVEHYMADGTAKSMTGNEISTGKWALVGDTVCFKYDAETECYKIEVVGNSATFTDAKGSGTRYDILKGNPKNL